ncbi:MAG: hypothetical protein MUF64_10800 [Polyangiaceae bacterium]|nr:hypothetical protein [Polyangiaceae bacterium]
MDPGPLVGTRPPGSPDLLQARVIMPGEVPGLQLDKKTQAAVLVVHSAVLKVPMPPPVFTLSLRVPGEPGERPIPLLWPPGNAAPADSSREPLPAGHVLRGAFWIDLADVLGGKRPRMGTALRVRHGSLAETSVQLGPR